jgi:hypothetical protein
LAGQLLLSSRMATTERLRHGKAELERNQSEITNE